MPSIQGLPGIFISESSDNKFFKDLLRMDINNIGIYYSTRLHKREFAASTSMYRHIAKPFLLTSKTLSVFRFNCTCVRLFPICEFIFKMLKSVTWVNFNQHLKIWSDTSSTGTNFEQLSHGERSVYLPSFIFKMHLYGRIPESSLIFYILVSSKVLQNISERTYFLSHNGKNLALQSAPFQLKLVCL